MIIYKLQFKIILDWILNSQVIVLSFGSSFSSIVISPKSEKYLKNTWNSFQWHLNTFAFKSMCIAQEYLYWKTFQCTWPYVCWPPGPEPLRQRDGRPVSSPWEAGAGAGHAAGGGHFSRTDHRRRLLLRHQLRRTQNLWLCEFCIL